MGKQRRVFSWVSRSIALAAMLALGLAASGCGAAAIKNDEVIKALRLVKPGQRQTYSVGGDPFCEIRRDLLDGKDKVDAARRSKAKRRLLVTNSPGTVGVIGVSPFGGDCKRRVVAGMSTIK
ncbi:MAG: hypothetical protein QOG09_1258 [Solirubrobacterales bacterium]|jgi:hypothetical protein|nr:hypothetical protein [Solirubrobacterales bacterium]MDX6663156.1 hypothetical protein [Solirubrobacterales bacterium]